MKDLYWEELKKHHEKDVADIKLNNKIKIIETQNLISEIESKVKLSIENYENIKIEYDKHISIDKKEKKKTKNNESYKKKNLNLKLIIL